MCTDPIVLIDKILENLEILSALSLNGSDGSDAAPDDASGPGEAANEPRMLTPDDFKRHQAAKAIESLVPRLRDALGELRDAGPPPDVQGSSPQRVCVNCED
jgi:hypothetical protein